MVFKETKLKGAYIIEIDSTEDARGFFARSFCIEEFNKHGLNHHIAQCNISYNEKKGTLRGMHYQAPPHEEAKLVRCTMGAIYDLALDLRPDSPTFKHWVASELRVNNHRMFYIPEGVAHGFQTLEDHTEVFYQMSEFYHPECSRGVRWDDPKFGIKWPLEPILLSSMDRSFKIFNDDVNNVE
jgi:dTDP-4-dehydrorhamnose 3,5-epimerase